MIDFHCHLDLYPDPLRIAAECRERGMHVLSVTTTPTAWSVTKQLSQGGDKIRTALGLHPQLAHERHSELALFDDLIPEVPYVGEVGLDYAPEFRGTSEVQGRVFAHILNACSRAGGRIISIHSRQASRAVLDMIEEYPGAGAPILHWFSGSSRDLDRAIALGCWFSVGPAMLKSERGRGHAARIPRNRVLTESDGPFARINGSAVVPWQVQEAVNDLGQIWSLSLSEASRILRANLRVLVQSTQATDTASERG
jgi:TatD DNase family protein